MKTIVAILITGIYLLCPIVVMGQKNNWEYVVQPYQQNETDNSFCVIRETLILQIGREQVQVLDFDAYVNEVVLKRMNDN